jgi:hydrophobe/amphiphile efflux-3 (HAE3) family protein
MRWLGKFVMRYPKWIIAIIIAITLFFGYFIPQVRFNNDAGDFIPPSDQERIYNEEIQEIFGNDDVIYIGFLTENVYDPKALAKIATLTSLIEEVDGVVDVTSLSSVKNIEGTEEGMDVYPFVDEDAPPETDEDGQKIREQLHNWDVLVNNLVSEDGKATSIVVQLESNADMSTQERVFAEVKAIIEEHKKPGESYHYSGYTTINVLLGVYMLADMKRLLPVAFVVVALCLYLSFRSLNGVILPLINVGISVIWTIGCMALLGVELSLPCTAIPVILVSVGSAYAIHVIHDYYDELKRGMIKNEAFLSCFHKVGLAVVMAGLTTVAGFGTLVTSDVIPLKDFGTFVAFGTFVSLVLALTFVPAVLYLENAPTQDSSKRASHIHKKHIIDSLSGAFLKRVVSTVMNNQAITVITGIVVFGIAIWGTLRVFVDDNGIAYFRQGTEVRNDDDVLNTHFGGTHLYSVIITGPEADSMKEPEILKDMELLQQHIQETFPFIGKTMSLADYVKKMNMAMNENQPEFYTLPDPHDENSRELVAQYLLLYSMSGEPDDFDDVVDYEYQQARLIILAKDGSTIQTQKVVDEIYAYTKKHFDDRYTVRVTGSAYTPLVMDKHVVAGSKRSIISSLIAVWILTSIIFRSFSGGLFSIIPLSLAVLVNFAIMGFLNIPLEVGTSIVSNAAIGIGVDYAIHFLSRFRHEMITHQLPHTNEGFFQAALQAATTSGQAIIYNAVAVAAGFLVLVFSLFMPLVRLGALVAAIMFTTSAGSIILLPVLLSVCKPKFITKTLTSYSHMVKHVAKNPS